MIRYLLPGRGAARGAKRIVVDQSTPERARSKEFNPPSTCSEQRCVSVRRAGSPSRL